MTATAALPTTRPAPFLRWAGGKRRLLKVLNAGMPTQFNTFYEPFLGGGAVYLTLDHPGERCVVSDMNTDLIAAYRAIRDNLDELVDALREHQANVSEEWFYALRAAEPTTDLERAARFIAYNRTSFNGLFRVNSKGKWNTPYGKLKKPTVCNEPLLRAVADRLVGTDIRCGTYTDGTLGAGIGDFVYLDPPYLPISATASFSKYDKDDFTAADHQALATHVQQLRDAGAHVMLSNSDTPLVREIFAGMNLHQVSVHRSISAKATSRENVHEVLATTYPLDQMADPDTFLTLATPLA